ncbi:NUDIX hydrolase [Dietzia sp. NCCP-2495]|uniref:NUDIX hydrolase n=1 Tax=Dietzia sp. NCCP-2495 TaxID=2934675 RepID=UPI0022319DAB|nr:NUDIX hydrolase [Dietzia sp. NCCP-2495]GLB65255.1 NUDIX hydrolase [Dietzia sp. NCCP-2495]
MTTDTQKQGGESTHTVKSDDGTAGATSRQPHRTSRGTGRPKSGSGHATSASTTRSGPPARSGGKPGATSSGKNQTKNPRGARTGNRHPRSGQRMRTVLETSAGGLVVRGLAQAAAVEPEPDLSRLEVALIGRLDRRGRMLWSMPKGHIEPGETIEETARREALEETGADSTVLGPLGIIDYWFVAEGRRIHKTVHHHLMRYDHGELCDEDPEITEVAWVAFDDLPRRLAYPDERRLVEKARTLLPEIARDELAGRNPAPAAAQQVDPSRRADGPAPVRRTGQGNQSGAGKRNTAAKPGARHHDDAPEESTS